MFFFQALLLESGADPNVEDRNGKTALDQVWENNNIYKSYDDRVKMIQLLEEHNSIGNKYKDR